MKHLLWKFVIVDKIIRQFPCGNLFPMYPFLPLENIRKPYGFLMFSGVRERVHWERMNSVNSWELQVFYKRSVHKKISTSNSENEETFGITENLYSVDEKILSHFSQNFSNDFRLCPFPVPVNLLISPYLSLLIHIRKQPLLLKIPTLDISGNFSESQIWRS